MMESWRDIRKKLVLKPLSLKVSVPTGYLEKYRELIYLNQIIDDLKINCVIDVGANVGQFAKDLRCIGFKGQIFSFEPIRSEFEILSSRFKYDANWSGYQRALGIKNEKMTINIPEDTSMSSLKTFNFNAETRPEEITVFRLDEIFDSLHPNIRQYRILLKMDTQGYDSEVFSGASGCLSNIRAIMSEISVKPLYEGVPDYKESLGMYEQEGFKLCNLSIVMRNQEREIVELNCLMKRS